ncbi:MAG: hypothetical protein ACEPOZ_04610 [Marinifilaceae bacterium]
MKMKLVGYGLLTTFSMGVWSCSDSSDDSINENKLTLKESIAEKTMVLDEAVAEISSSKGYQILSLNDKTTAKSGIENSEEDNSLFSASITLENLKGVYDYSPSNEDTEQIGGGITKFFTQTDSSEQFIVRLPKEKATNYRTLFQVSEADSALVNDFVITTSDFLYSYTGGMGFSYLLDTRIDVEEEFAGALKINWELGSQEGMSYSSSYTFTNDLTMGIEFTTGDTTSYIYGLTQGEETLYSERISFLKSEDSYGREREYSLTIGNIEIIRSSASDEIQVFKDGVLQENAIVEVLSETNGDTELTAFCRKGRDLQITFDDGTTVVLSELVGDSLETLDEMFSSLRNVYFATHLVNHMALNIYNTQK